MPKLSEKQRIEILIMIGCGDKMRSQLEVCEMFNNVYPDQQITQSTVSKIYHKFEETGSVKDVQRSGRPKKLNNYSGREIMLDLRENPINSMRKLAQHHDVSKSIIHRYVKKQKWSPFKVHEVQELLPDDPGRRVQFCEAMSNIINENPNFLHNVIFSDEATFYLHGTVNRQTTRYWSDINPHWTQETHSQRPQKINVWAGIIGDRILGPYFFEENVNGDVYLNFLQFELLPVLIVLFPHDDEPNLVHERIWFQQDGAPAHYAVNVRRFLDETFPNRWIGRRGAVEWPPRSPDITPLDFYLWGYLKSRVYVNRPGSIEELKIRITEVIREIPPDTISSSVNAVRDRIGYCQVQNGGHFEQLL